MAKFSKGQYVVLMRALSLARDNVKVESKLSIASYEAELDHLAKHVTIPISLSPETWAKFGFETAAKYIADALGMDNPKFDRSHFLAVVRGEKPVNSRPASSSSSSSKGMYRVHGR